MEDVLIDSIWQVNQDLDNGLLNHLEPTPTQPTQPPAIDDTMEVDDAAATASAAKNEDQLANEVAANLAAAQARLATFAAALIVSSRIDKSATQYQSLT